MKRLLVTCSLVVLAAVPAGGQETGMEVDRGASAYDQLDNLWLAAGAGYMMPDDQDSTWLFFGTLNYGFPLYDDWGLGWQAGGQVLFRDDDPDWTGALGLFQREAPLEIQREAGLEEVAWALQGLYVRTHNDADLAGLKPVVGAYLDDINYLVLTGIWGINDENVSRTPPEVVELVDQAMLAWGTRWMDGALRTEVGGGYAFGNVEEAIVGAHAGWNITEIMSVNVTGQMDLEGNYYAALSLGFDLGADGANASFNNMAIREGTRYTPFPIEGLPVIFYESEERVFGGGFGGGGF
jgi:hypothetical protein